MTPDELKAWYKGRGLTQAEAAVELGIAFPSLSNYVRGLRPIPEDVAARAGALAPVAVAEAVQASLEPEPVRPVAVASGFDPVAAGLRPYPTTNTIWGASASWDTRPPKPGWQRVPGCIRIVRAGIPDPLPFYGPDWAGENGVPTASGVIYNALTGDRMRDYRNEVKLVRPAWSNPKKQKGDK